MNCNKTAGQILILFGYIVGLFALGCSGDGSTMGPDGLPASNNQNDNAEPAITLAQLSAEIFTPKCATSGCHSGASPDAGLSLTTANIAEETIGVPASGNSNFQLFAPGDPVNSYVLMKVRGDEGIVGSQMPRGGGRLSEDEIAKIVAWVEAGAQVASENQPPTSGS